LFFEHGTKDHWIEPKNKKALHWIETGGGSPQSIYSQGSEFHKMVMECFLKVILLKE
jgi:hypothetical protein